MKKFLLTPLILLLVTALTLGILASRDLSFSVGRCVVTDDTCMLVLGNDPVLLCNRTGKDGAFATLVTGDRLLVLHGDIMETWPAQAIVYFCLPIGSGSMDDIPQDVVDSLIRCGWLVQAP